MGKRFGFVERAPAGAVLVGSGELEVCTPRGTPMPAVLDSLEGGLSRQYEIRLEDMIEAACQRRPTLRSRLEAAEMLFAWNGEPRELRQVEGIVTLAVPVKVGFTLKPPAGSGG